MQGSHTSKMMKFQDFSRTFPGPLSNFKDLFDRDFDEISLL